MDIFVASKKKSAAQEGLLLALSLAGLAMTLAAAIILPLLLIPIAVVGGGFLAWYNNDGRKERLAREHTERLYNAVKAPVVEIEENLRTYTRGIPRDAEVELLDIGRRFYQIEGASLVPPIPAVCNSIEGARYRDMLSKIGATSNQTETEKLKAISFMVAFCYKERPINEEKIAKLVRYVEGKKEYLRDTYAFLSEKFADGYDDWMEKLDGTLFCDAMMVEKEPDPVDIPSHLRTQHALVIAGTGFGKSQLFQSMILDDLETPGAIVVIDSQNDLINKLATRVPQGRLMLFDAVESPPALNIFALGDPGLLEYVFGALDAKMTSQMQMVYRYLCRQVIAEGGNTSTLLDMLINQDREYETRGEAARAFFAEYKKPKGQYADTRQHIMRRLLTVLENETFERMLTSTELRIDMHEAVRDEKIILVNTAKADTGGDNAALFGRFWLALVLKTAMQGSRQPIRLYVDEFADYSSDELETIFTQARKYNLAMTCAFQNLAQLPDRLRGIVLTNTAIKLAGGVNASDARALAAEMRCDTSFIEGATRGTFAAWFRDEGTAYYPVTFGRLEKLPELARLRDIHADMRDHYGTRDGEIPPSPTPPPPTPPKNSGSEPPEQGRGVGKRSFMVDDQD